MRHWNDVSPENDAAWALQPPGAPIVVIPDAESEPDPDMPELMEDLPDPNLPSQAVWDEAMEKMSDHEVCHLVDHPPRVAVRELVGPVHEQHQEQPQDP